MPQQKDFETVRTKSSPFMSLIVARRAPLFNFKLSSVSRGGVAREERSKSCTRAREKLVGVFNQVKDQRLRLRALEIYNESFRLGTSLVVIYQTGRFLSNNSLTVCLSALPNHFLPE